MKHFICVFLFLICRFGFGQHQEQRISNIQNQLDLLAVEIPGLSENIKTDINVSSISISSFLLAISEVHELNINIAPSLNNTIIANNFSNVTVADLLIFLCKEHQLTIDFTGSILSIKPHVVPPPKVELPIVDFQPQFNALSLDLNEAPLFEAFKTIMDRSGKNLVFAPGMETHPLTTYMKDVPFDVAMDKLALGNGLIVTKTKDDFFVFDKEAIVAAGKDTPIKRNTRRNRNSNVDFNILDKPRRIVSVNLVETPIQFVIEAIAEALELNVFTASPLDKIGNVSFKTENISFDDLLIKIFESQGSVKSTVQANPTNNRTQNTVSSNPKTSNLFTYKKEGNTYFFGLENQLSLRSVEVVPLQFRSVELLNDPSGGVKANNTSNAVLNNYNSVDTNNNRNIPKRGSNNNNQNNNNGFGNYQNDTEALISLLPDELIDALEVKVDYELNSFYVNGPSAKVERFKNFIKEIDKPVPVILIEVMIVETDKNFLTETGISMGIGDQPAVTQGTVFPQTNMTLGANTVNNIIGGINSFTGFNLGKVGPNFYATIKAMESNGDLKIKSTPRLATLNSHRATFSNGQTSFYAVTERNIYGTDNPQTSEITNYLPIEAELGLTIKPSVSGNGQVLLDISVIQSSFGTRIADDAPPNVNSRSFSSLIRMQDQDIAVLGGLEEQMSNDSGSGVPFLARVPVIKWLFSSRKREAKKSKLTVLIKPTVIN